MRGCHLREPADWGKGWLMFLVTGGAGFIGSNVVASLNEAGAADIVVNDLFGHDDAKWRNLAKHRVADLVPPAELMAWLDAPQARRRHPHGRHLRHHRHRRRPGDGEQFPPVAAPARLVHGDRTPFIYASSAATYGDGAQGFDDDWSPAHLRKLQPMNLYGWSKHLFDLALAERYVKKDKLPPHWAGLKFFNVYGPNEYHKGHMMSVLAKVFDGAKAGKPVRLFKSHRAGIADGEQRRDFIYVDDAIAVLRWLLDTSSVNGIFNVGTGKAESFRDMIGAMFKALGRAPNIEYIDMPEAIRGQYQYFTQSKIENLRRAGYNAGFTPLEDAVGAIRHRLSRPRRPLSLSSCSTSTNSSPPSPIRPCSASAI